MDILYRGLATHAASTGDLTSATKPTLVFIHGAQQDNFCWAALASPLAARGFPVLAPDLPGHGGSAGPPLTSVAALADWVGGLLDHIGVARVGLIGHSLGSLVALETASHYPDRLVSLTLLGTAAPMAVSPGLLAAATDDPTKAMSLINRWSHSTRGSLGGENRVSGNWIPIFNLRQMQRQPVATLPVDLLACQAYGDAVAAARRVACPTLVVIGGADRMTPASAAQPIVAALRQVQVESIPNTGHALMTEQPDILRRLILTHVEAAGSQASQPNRKTAGAIE